MALMVQMIISFIRYKWCRDQDDSLGRLSVQYIIWLEEECGGSAVYADEAGSTEDTIYSDMVPLWLNKRPSLIEGVTSFHQSV